MKVPERIFLSHNVKILGGKLYIIFTLFIGSLKWFFSLTNLFFTYASYGKQNWFFFFSKDKRPLFLRVNVYVEVYEHDRQFT